MRRLAEGLLFFAVVPVLLWRHWLPAGWTLLAVFVVVLVVLQRDPTFRWRPLWAWAPSREVRRVLLRFALCVVPLTVLSALLLPGLFLRFPAERPALFLAVSLGYPLLSVVPQEILFRAFFHHRYLGDRVTWTGAALSAAVFGWAHLLMNHWVAVALSTVGGWFFARTWQRTRSLPLVSLEHALYGVLLFALGLGWFFWYGRPGR